MGEDFVVQWCRVRIVVLFDVIRSPLGLQVGQRVRIRSFVVGLLFQVGHRIHKRGLLVVVALFGEILRFAQDDKERWRWWLHSMYWSLNHLRIIGEVNFHVVVIVGFDALVVDFVVVLTGLSKELDCLRPFVVALWDYSKHRRLVVDLWLVNQCLRKIRIGVLVCK